tara:strand:- start:487 stop:600 length:114 start_codon:yes stop_codon:yes gene_type:complete
MIKYILLTFVDKFDNWQLKKAKKRLYPKNEKTYKNLF